MPFIFLTHFRHITSSSFFHISQGDDEDAYQDRGLSRVICEDFWKRNYYFCNWYKRVELIVLYVLFVAYTYKQHM